MRHDQLFYAITLALLLAACSESAPAEKSKASGPVLASTNEQEKSASEATGDDEQTDEEGKVADRPAQVSGAFLVDCEAISEKIPFFKTEDGETVGACRVLDKKTGQPAAIKPGTLEIKLQAEDGSEVLPEKLLPTEESGYHFYVIATPARLQNLVILLIGFVDALADAAKKYGEDEFVNDPENVGITVAWEQFGGMINTMDLPSSPIVPMPADGRHQIFVSHLVYPPNFEGLSGADALCGELGKTINATASWTALLSTTKVHAKDRVAIVGPIYNVMGDLIASDGPGLWLAVDGAKHGKIKWTERGFDTSAYVFPALKIEINNVWTGSTSRGEYNATHGACKDWTSVTYEDRGANGSADSDSGRWMDVDRNVACSQLARIYCLSH